MWRVFRIALLVAIVMGALVAAAYVLKLDDQVKTQFAGKLWALPARVFARPLELYEGQTLFADNLEKELQLLNYSKVSGALSGTGQFSRAGNTFRIHSRGFRFAEDTEAERVFQLTIRKGRISSLKHLNNNSPLNLMRMEPLLIGNFYPSHNEDRVLVQLDEVAPLLIKGLIAVEDKNYYDHVGVNPKSIMRALLANAKAGQMVQGGSTLTQQLVKNFYLTNERSLKRKINEAIMSLLLELHYSKEKILETYLNEIYLGQNKKRAIHGFGLASQFYFSKPIRELETDQVALLIGMAKGASYYDPRRFPARALERRNLVLDVMAREKVITAEEAAISKAKPLHITANAPPSVSPFPAYLELVKSQLQRDYQEEDLQSEGLLIFTAMDPIVQLISEKVLSKRVAALERSQRIARGKLNGALVVSSVQNGEVLSVVGGRDVRYAGYNRAMDARRQIGSLVKPGVYLAALEKPKKYTLSSLISDGPVKVKLSNGDVWEPNNYDHRDLGNVILEEALVKSRNTPTVRVGVTMGMNNIVDKLHQMGITQEIPPYPSVLLGALELSPLEVQQMYQTIASGGMYTPLKSIRSVMDSFGRTLRRYPLSVKQVTTPEANYLLTYAMNQVTKSGTASYLSKVLPAWKNSAGKTGTTNNKRDSWYAGFTGQHVASVWIGRDDNKETGLTGGTGAIKVWGDLFRVLPTKPLKPPRPARIRFVKIDKETGLLYNRACGKPLTMPFIRGTQPRRYRVCTVVAPPDEEQEPAAVPVVSDQ
ncbi:MAG: penicillin-binding protein 1B [Proteobacteria bacterium]|nr:MAG: penicillin-binding protein 1B [Pseudomonadota bacterium]